MGRAHRAPELRRPSFAASPSARGRSATSRCGTAGRSAEASRTRIRPPTCPQCCSRSPRRSLSVATRASGPFRLGRLPARARSRPPSSRPGADHRRRRPGARRAGPDRPTCPSSTPRRALRSPAPLHSSARTAAKRRAHGNRRTAGSPSGRIDSRKPLGGAEMFGDRFAPVEYRRHLAGSSCRRALDPARARARGGSPSDRDHRRRATTARRAREGHRRDAVRGGRARPRPAPRPPRPGNGGACADPGRSTEKPRSQCRASSPCSPPPTSRRRRPARDRTAEPLAREEVVFAGQPVAIVVAESEAAAEDGAELVIVEYEPLAAVVDVEAAMEPGVTARPRSRGGGGRRRPRVDPRRGRSRAGGRRARSRLSGKRPRPRPPERGRRRRRARGERRRRLGDIQDAVGLPGVPRAPGLRPRGSSRRDARRLDEHAGLVRHAQRARAGLRPSARADSRDRRAARRRLRREVRARRAARRRRGARPQAASAPHLHAQRGLPGDEPGLGPGHRISGSAPAPTATLTGIEARMIVDRGSNTGWGVEGITSLLVAGPYRWQAHDLRGYGVQTNRFTFGAYRAPGAPDGSVRGRVAARRARSEARHRPDRAAPAKRRRRRRRRSEREALRRHRRRRGPRAPARPSALARARLAARGRGRRASRSATGPAGRSPPRRCAAWTRTER